MDRRSSAVNDSTALGSHLDIPSPALPELNARLRPYFKLTQRSPLARLKTVETHLLAFIDIIVSKVPFCSQLTHRHRRVADPGTIAERVFRGRSAIRYLPVLAA